ncbi:hypothetical protein BS78_03G234100 [Paspalum vaginatum]|nr:hypothetical protein BS78_03G234100 [Paspalum vaginatum]
MVLMAAVENDRRRRGAKLSSSPQYNPLSSAPRPSSRTRLHDFSFPTLSWGTHRLLRCSKTNGPASSPSPAPAAPEDPYPDKEPHRAEARGSRSAQGPWNLRARRSATAAPTRPAGSEDADEEAGAAAPATEAKKRVFSVALSKQEVVEDFAAIRGTRPPRRPKKRPRTVQRQLDLLYPGLCLADVTPGSYKIEER